MIKRIMLAIAIGVLASAGLMALSFAADSYGFISLARGLFWQNSLLQGFAPLGNVGTSAHPIYEGSPLNFLAFLASIPVGVTIYSLVAYAVLSVVRRRAYHCCRKWMRSVTDRPIRATHDRPNGATCAPSKRVSNGV